ncbi:MAG: ATP-binding protein [Moraxella sp.]|nr:ATP-binding protein [Moraxella sp.]
MNYNTNSQSRLLVNHHLVASELTAVLDVYPKAICLVKVMADGFEMLWENQVFVAMVARQFAEFPKELQEVIETASTFADGKSVKVVLPSWSPKFDRLAIRTLKSHGNVFVSIEDYSYIHQLEQMRTDFVGNVSHELRTPLTVMLGYLETFIEFDVDERLQRGIVRMQEQAVRMNSLVNDLLTLSSLENAEDLELVQLDMPRLLMQVFDEVQLHNSEALHLIDLHLDTQDNVMGLWLYLHSAILNLVINAIKYTPMGGEINISWERVGDGCLLTVADNGIGIATEHLERLTERFYRVDSGRSRATGGTGLGLAIVKHVVQKHGASLSISSQEGRGSAFKILFDKSSIVAVA